MKQLLLLLFVTLAGVVSVQAQNTPTGIWKTVDDETGEAKSHVEIYQDGGKYHGKITKLLQYPQDQVCEACTGSRKGKKLVGMVPLWTRRPATSMAVRSGLKKASPMN